MRIASTPAVPAARRPAPRVVARTAQTVPAVKVAARGVDPLPKFASSEQYKTYVVNLVAKAQVAQADLESARKRLNEGKASRGDVQLAQERLDAIKLQLVILRDQYEIPSKWTRPRFFFGEGFDKAKFWREQVEAIPGYDVVVPPKPEKPAEPPKPAPEKPAAPTKSALPSGPATGPAAAAGALVEAALGTDRGMSTGSTGDQAARRAFTDAIDQVLTLTNGASDARLLAMREVAAAAKDVNAYYNWNGAGNDPARFALRESMRELQALGQAQGEHPALAIGALDRVAQSVDRAASTGSTGDQVARKVQAVAIARIAGLAKGAEPAQMEAIRQIAAVGASVNSYYNWNAAGNDPARFVLREVHAQLEQALGAAPASARREAIARLAALAQGVDRSASTGSTGDQAARKVQSEAIKAIVGLTKDDPALLTAKMLGEAAMKSDAYYNWNGAGNDQVRPILRTAIENILSNMGG